MAEAFDPKAYLASKTQEQAPFDPKAYLASKTQESKPEMSQLETIKTVAPNALTFGLAPFAAGVGGGAGAGYGTFENNSNLPIGDRLSKSYDAAKQGFFEARGDKNKEIENAEKANPKTAFATNLGSGLIGGLPMAAAQGYRGAMAAGALAGGAQGLSKAETPGQLATNIGIGAATGGLTQKLGNAISNIPETAKTLAGRALGAERGTIKKLGMDKIKAAGQQALDEKVLSPLASTEDMITRNEALKAKGGGLMNQAYEAIDSNNASTFNPKDVAGKVNEKIGDFYRSPINRSETNQLENTLESISMRGDKNIPLSKAQELKEEIGKVANWKNTLNTTDKERMAREAYGVISDEIDSAVKSGSDAVSKAGLSDVLKQGKSIYSNAKTAEGLLQNKEAREQGNKMLGLTDWGLLGVGGPISMATHSPGAAIGTLGLLGAKKGLERYGAQNSAIALNNLTKIVDKIPTSIRNKGSEAIQNYLKSPQGQALIQGGPQGLITGENNAR